MYIRMYLYMYVYMHVCIYAYVDLRMNIGIAMVVKKCVHNVSRTHIHERSIYMCYTSRVAGLLICMSASFITCGITHSYV